MEEQDIEFFQALTGLVKLSKQIMEDCVKRIPARSNVVKGIQKGIKRYGMALHKTQGKNVETHHRSNVALIFRRNKIAFLTVKEDPGWIYGNKNLVISYGESLGIRPKKPVRIPVGHIYALASDLKDEAGKLLKGQEAKNWDKDIAKLLNYPDALLWYLFRCFSTMTILPALPETKNSEEEKVSSSEMKTLKKLKKHYAEIIGVAKSKGGLSSLMNLASGMVSDLGGGDVNMSEMPLPDEDQLMSAIGDIFQDTGFKNSMSGIMEKVTKQDDLGGVMNVMGEVFQDGSFQKGIQNTVESKVKKSKKTKNTKKPTSTSTSSSVTKIVPKSKVKSSKLPIKPTKATNGHTDIEIISDSDDDEDDEDELPNGDPR